MNDRPSNKRLNDHFAHSSDLSFSSCVPGKAEVEVCRVWWSGGHAFAFVSSGKGTWDGDRRVS